MGGYLTSAHVGSACEASSVIQWRKAFRRQSSMNSGSPFLAEIRRMVFSLRPLGTRSSSMSLMNPHLYSRSARSRIVSTFVLMVCSLRSAGSQGKAGNKISIACFDGRHAQRMHEIGKSKPLQSSAHDLIDD